MYRIMRIRNGLLEPTEHSGPSKVNLQSELNDMLADGDLDPGVYWIVSEVPEGEPAAA